MTTANGPWDYVAYAILTIAIAGAVLCLLAPGPLRSDQPRWAGFALCTVVVGVVLALLVGLFTEGGTP